MRRKATTKASLPLVLLLAAGCSDEPAPNPSPLARAVPEDTLITLERGDCDGGGCPAYRLTITADGSVVFDGQSRVKVAGAARGRITQQRRKELLAEFERIKYFSLNDRYLIGPDGCTGYMHHGAVITTSLRVNGQFKRVERYTGCLGVAPDSNRSKTAWMKWPRRGSG